MSRRRAWRSDRLGSEPDDFGIALDLHQYRERVVAIESANNLMVVQMKKLAGLAATALALGTVQASAAEVAMRRVFSCVGPDAKMEIYIPESLWSGLGVQNAKLDKQATGAYILDLTDAGKGKMLEPVHVQYSNDKKSVVVTQYTRGLPPTTIAVGGATVDFDQRFGTQAKCGPFNQE